MVLTSSVVLIPPELVIFSHILFFSTLIFRQVTSFHSCRVLRRDSYIILLLRSLAEGGASGGSVDRFASLTFQPYSCIFNNLLYNSLRAKSNSGGRFFILESRL